MSTYQTKYDKELYEYFNTCTQPTAFGLGIGKGKTATVIHYIHEQARICPLKRILIIENNIDNLNELYSELGGLLDIWHSDLQDHPNFTEFMKFPRLAITKAKFFQLLVREQYDILNSYNEYFWDEFSGLNPLAVTELASDISAIGSQLSKRTHTAYTIQCIEFFTNLVKIIQSQVYRDNTTYRLELSKQQQETAGLLFSQYWALRDDERTKYLVNLDIGLLVVLKALKDQNLWISRYSPDDYQQRYAIAVRDDAIKHFITEKKFFVLDATAYYNKASYDYLGIQTISEFARNEINFDNLTIHIHDTSNINTHDIRNGEKKSIVKLFPFIKDTQVHTFVPKKSWELFTDKLGFPENKLYYFFSGKDIGTNDLRLTTDMNVVAGQTYPRVMRVLYNHLLMNMPLQEANHPQKDLAELHWFARNIVQLIGRTALREYNNTPVNIHYYVIKPSFAYYIRDTYFKGCKIIHHRSNETHTTTSKMIFDALEYLVSTQDTTNVTDFLKQYYDKPKTISDFLTKHKQQLIIIAQSHNKTYEKLKRGDARIAPPIQ
jgi:hypothetical protein